MGFFVNNVYGGRSPYRVEPIQRDKPADEGGGQNFFGQREEDPDQKFKKASKKLYEKRSVVIASEIMNRQIMRLEGSLSVKDAWEKIKHHDIKYFPVISAEGKLLGLLSDKDILRELDQGGGKRLEELTKEHTLCADPDTELGDIMRVFADQSIEAVPVIDETHQILGILTQNELLQTMLKISHLKW